MINVADCLSVPVFTEPFQTVRFKVSGVKKVSIQFQNITQGVIRVSAYNYSLGNGLFSSAIEEI